MTDHVIPILQPLNYVYTGKFKAPTPEWRHLTRDLKDWELIIMLEGTLYMTLDDKKYTLSEKDFLLCPPNCRQIGFQSAYSSFYWLHFTIPPENEAAITSTSDSITNCLILDESGTLKSLDKLIVMMKQLQDSIRSYNDSTYNNFLTTSILLEFAHASKPASASVEKNVHHRQLYIDILDYVKWNINDNIKVLDVADHFGYNPKYLSHIFNNIAGYSLKQHIQNEKIAKAKFILNDTNDTITSISQQLGFSDSHSFMKLFKKQVGLTPSEYRNTYNKRMMFYV